jgi:hypothetical protein
MTKTLNHIIFFSSTKIRIDIGSTSVAWDGVDSVQLTGKTLVSAEQPARTDTKISYNNLEDKVPCNTCATYINSDFIDWVL